MEERKARKEKRKEESKKRKEESGKWKENSSNLNAQTSNLNPQSSNLQKGDNVRIKGLNTIGTIESIQGKQATVIFGDVRSKVKVEQLERVESGKWKVEGGNAAQKHADLAIQTSKVTRSTMEDRKQNFHQDIDVRGMRGDEAIDTVMHFIDDAILIGMSRVRILHGTGSGILRQLIRQYLRTVPNVKSCKDEHVQFGGAGITVVDID
jgi:DNA mismatch repair protein MutS2